ncbi:Stk1 family PASTA domain-containing Ser/Thr kinase, partial [Streptomyces sp. ISL-11]|uniref:Stk1 family PASTA domain-containing Ser/Thr kinase n=1 Tax=Streptomyces sp. ISL-11 TaxID=2819174 RepID=UPI001BE65C9C
PGAPRPARGRPLPRRGLLAALAAVLVLVVSTGIWYISSGQFTTVPAVLDMPREKAEKELGKAGLGVKVEQDFSDTIERGHVMTTDPGAGDRIRSTGKVTITVSRGPARSEVPNVVGMPLDKAKEKIKGAGLAVGETGQQFSDETPQGSVLATDPAPGAQRRPDSPVALTVSKGRALDVPDVTGLSVADATAALRDKGLNVEVAGTEVFSDKPKGAVAGHSPAKGEQLAKGDTVTLTVSKGQEMVGVPDVTGKSEAEARRTLTAAGFKVQVERPFFFPRDSVESQSVKAGDQAPKGSAITIKLKGGL